MTDNTEVLFRAFQRLKKLDSKFPINAALTLFYIAKHEPCVKQDLEKSLGFTCASGSRNTDYLSANNRLRKPGLGFINKEDLIEDRRQSVLTLTQKGRDFIHQLEEPNYALERSG